MQIFILGHIHLKQYFHYEYLEQVMQFGYNLVYILNHFELHTNKAWAIHV